MSDPQQNPARDLASYLLGELDESDRRDFARILAMDPSLAEEAAGLGRIVTRLDAVAAEAWELPEPPALRLDPQALSEAEAPRQAPAVPSPAKARHESFLGRLFGGSMRLQPALAAGLVVLIFAGGLGAGLLIAGDSDTGADGQSVLAAQAIELQPVGTLNAGASGKAQLEDSGAKIRIRVNGLQPNRAGDFYEAWLMDQRNGLVSIGSFKVGDDGSAEIDLPVPVDPESFPVVDISLEPSDGSPAHSGKSVLRAEIS